MANRQKHEEVNREKSARIFIVGTTHPSIQDCENISEVVAAGKDEDITGGATSYYDISIPPLAWAANGSDVLTISVGRLRFYQLTPMAVTDIELGM